jgi:ABC-type glutathione transport system ATPase component
MSKKNTKVIIQLKEVVKAYVTNESPFLAIKDVSFDILQSEFPGISFNSANL